jgi:hypothetical protein
MGSVLSIKRHVRTRDSYAGGTSDGGRSRDENSTRIDAAQHLDGRDPREVPSAGWAPRGTSKSGHCRVAQKPSALRRAHWLALRDTPTGQHTALSKLPG